MRPVAYLMALAAIEENGALAPTRTGTYALGEHRSVQLYYKGVRRIYHTFREVYNVEWRPGSESNRHLQDSESQALSC